LATLRGGPEPELNRDLYFVRREGGEAYGGKTIDAFRRGDWKLLQDSPFAPCELYDLQTDPLEATNLAGRRRKIFGQLEEGLRRQIQRGGQVPWQAPSALPPTVAPAK
jgi:arylsulfatase A-like enzyme